MYKYNLVGAKPKLQGGLHQVLALG